VTDAFTQPHAQLAVGTADRFLCIYELKDDATAVLVRM
jgi:hypothetical protein